MLDDVERVLSDSEGELESRFKPITSCYSLLLRNIFLLGVEVNDLAILENLLLSGENTGEHLDGVVLALENKPPNVLLLRTTSIINTPFTTYSYDIKSSALNDQVSITFAFAVSNCSLDQSERDIR